jgi:hypothetical protein
LLSAQQDGGQVLAVRVSGIESDTLETSPMSNMAKQMLVRLAGAAGLLALAVFFIGLDPFLSAGASPTRPISVDRTFKADRLPASHQAFAVPDWRYEFSAFNPQPQAFACDAAFSTISSRAAANFFGRCLA